MAILTPKPLENQAVGSVQQAEMEHAYGKLKRSLGQNFLTDELALHDIISTINPKSGETIVEIGPGRGALTDKLIVFSLEFLGEKDIKVILIEKDPILAKELKAKYSKLKSVPEIIEGDALKVLPELANYKLKAKGYKLVGNIPYYITGYLFRLISELENKPSLAVFTIQKEVAERICASEGGMNLLAASIQVWAKPEVVRFVSRKGFYPVPKVDSAIIKLTFDRKQSTIDQSKNYYNLIKILFKQPRKTIFNNMKQLTIDDKQISKEELLKILAKQKIAPDNRPQDLTIEQLKKLSETLKRKEFLGKKMLRRPKNLRS